MIIGLVLLFVFFLSRRPPRIEPLLRYTRTRFGNTRFESLHCNGTFVLEHLAQPCSKEHGKYYRMIQYAMPDAQVLVDMDAGNGLVTAMMLQLWRNMLGVNAPLWYAIAPYDCGACLECKDSFQPVLPPEFRTCTQDRHCPNTPLPPLKLYSFGGSASRMNETMRLYPPHPVYAHKSWQGEKVEDILKVAGPLASIDQWMLHNAIGHIDFLRAGRGNVIEGARRALEKGKVTAMVFHAEAEDIITMEDYGYACYLDYDGELVKLTHDCWVDVRKAEGNTWCVFTRNAVGQTIVRQFDKWSVQWGDTR